MNDTEVTIRQLPKTREETVLFAGRLYRVCRQLPHQLSGVRMGKVRIDGADALIMQGLDGVMFLMWPVGPVHITARLVPVNPSLSA